MKKIYLIAILLIAFACSSVYIEVPGITVDKEIVQKGEKVTLSWEIRSNTDMEVWIETDIDKTPLFKDLPLKGSREVVVNSTTIFFLKAKAKNGKLGGESSVKVTVKE